MRLTGVRQLSSLPHHKFCYTDEMPRFTSADAGYGKISTKASITIIHSKILVSVWRLLKLRQRHRVIDVKSVALISRSSRRLTKKSQPLSGIDAKDVKESTASSKPVSSTSLSRPRAIKVPKPVLSSAPLPRVISESYVNKLRCFKPSFSL
ncbi:hypothetical protein [Parasitella parasitica]|uniref:Uncharacterized protein n=1 Tax=Parasitella parasitica TaxID=35722 RepID=A0A0B7NMB9_9FUNG|nr:hypothetical protein [Parasitella parasitica]